MGGRKGGRGGGKNSEGRKKGGKGDQSGGGGKEKGKEGGMGVKREDKGNLFTVNIRTCIQVLCSTIQSQAESGDVAAAAEGCGTPDSSLRLAPSLHLPRLYIR